MRDGHCTPRDAAAALALMAAPAIAANLVELLMGAL